MKRKVERGESNFEVCDLPDRINRWIIEFLLRDFGMKSTKRNVRDGVEGKYRVLEDGSIEFYARIPKESRRHNRVEDVFVFLPDRTGTDIEGSLVPMDYPGWIFEKYRDELWRLSHEISESVRKANSIYAFYPSEYFKRRGCQDDAIAACHCLLDLLHSLCRDLPVSVDKLQPVLEMLKREIDLIKAWKKKENKVLLITIKNEWERWQKVLKTSGEKPDIESGIDATGTTTN